MAYIASQTSCVEVHATHHPEVNRILVGTDDSYIGLKLDEAEQLLTELQDAVKAMLGAEIGAEL